jgi:hypothetical protein
MVEIEAFANLFKTSGSGGIGGANFRKGKELDVRQLAKDPEAYRKAKKDGLI